MEQSAIDRCPQRLPSDDSQIDFDVTDSSNSFAATVTVTYGPKFSSLRDEYYPQYCSPY